MAELILNVDDFEPQRYARSAVLRAAGFDVVDAASGREALEVVRERRPALVVLDIHLPDLDGFDVCRRIKADPTSTSVLVLHVSATFVDADARVEALDNGADGYLPEPLDSRELVAEARSLLRMAAAERSAREAALELQRREAEIASIYDSAPIGLCVFDAEGRFVRINRRLAEINGFPPEAHVGRTFREVLPGIAEQVEPLLRQVLDRGEPAVGVEITGEVPSQPGVARTWVENWFPIRDAAGRPVAVNVAAEEITHLKQVEEELRRANRIKDEFLATLSHELRTPLNAILGWSSLLQRGVLDPAATKQAIDAIARNADAQRQLIADVLDISRMISGKLRLQVADVDPAEVVGLAVESMRPAFEAKNVELTLAAAEAPGLIRADPDRLQQIAWNLLSNAVKFTPTGGRVSVRLVRHEGRLDLVVADTGAGIRQDFLAHVFDRFVQADSSSTRHHSGLGLGLSIVRQLVELHGGRVEAWSEGEGKGATFTVSLPAPERAEVAGDRHATDCDGPVAVQRLLAGLRVLVVDDLADARALASTVIEKAAGEVVLAGSGQEGLAAFTARRPDVVVADLAMPGMDGYEFLRRLRALPKEAGVAVPVVALTAYGSDEDRARALAAGFAAHLPKPALPAELVATIAAAARRAA